MGGPVGSARRRIDVLGVGIDPLDVDGLLDRVGALVGRGERGVVGYANVHVLNIAARDPGLRRFLGEADIVYADGNGVVLGARLLGESLPPRMTGADWIWPFAARAACDGWRVGWVGGEYGVAAEASRALIAREPALRVVFTGHGYPRADDDRLINAINDAGVDVLFVGMGTPHQERWVARHRERLAAPVVWCVGAAADFISGRVSRGPRALHERQEWLARLIVDPRRLWRRYLLGNPLFLARIAAQRRRAGER